MGVRLNEQNKISQMAPPSLYMKCGGVSPDGYGTEVMKCWYANLLSQCPDGSGKPVLGIGRGKAY